MGILSPRPIRRETLQHDSKSVDLKGLLPNLYWRLWETADKPENHVPVRGFEVAIFHIKPHEVQANMA